VRSGTLFAFVLLVAVAVLAVYDGLTKEPPVRASVSLAACHFRAGGALPDRVCTPGAVNHAVTQRTIKTTICKPGWATSVRPPQKVTEPQKFRSMRAYGIETTPGHAQLYEYDHLIPIELGGALDDTKNLFPEPHVLTVGGVDEGSFAKDKIENRLNRDVCSGSLSLAKARRAIRTNWLTVT
jgi:hypothetical protein